MPILTSMCDEVYVQDDGSSDGTLEFLRSLPNVNISLYSNPQPRPDREEGRSRQELVDKVANSSASYILFLDADEVPCPRFPRWLEENCETWGVVSAPWVHLWGDVNHVRVDSYRSPLGRQYHWEPSRGVKKFPLMSHTAGREYSYDLSVQLGGCSRFPQAPDNSALDGVLHQDQWSLLHLGYLRPDRRTGELGRSRNRQNGQRSWMRSIEGARRNFEEWYSLRKVQVSDWPSDRLWPQMQGDA
jgi:hypothetical protein